MEIKRVLITGVSGFIGKGLVKALHTDPGIKLFGHSRKPEEAQALYKNYKIEIIEKHDATNLDERGIDTIIHLAGIAHDLSNQYKAEDYYKVNDQGTRLLYDAFLQSCAKRFIFFSSIKAAVDTASVPVDESVAPEPVSPYGLSKLSAETYIRQSTPGMDKKYFILRPCMIHGPGNKGNLNLLYRYVRTGLPFPLGAFKNQRSFLSADNLNFIVSKLITKDVPSGIYHLADDGFLSTAGLFKLIADASGKKSAVLNVPPRFIKLGFKALRRSRKLDKLTEDMMVSNRKIKNALNCELPVSMREGLVRTIRSFGERE